MSLGVTIVDNTSEKILNEGGINYGVLIDDTITIIKEKIFAHTNNFFAETLLYYPNFLKLEIRGEKDTITITGSNSLLTYYNTLPQKPTLYITSILNVFNSEATAELYNKMKTDEHISLYDQLVTNFVDLTLDDFNAIIKMKMYDLNKRSNIPILSNQESDVLKTDLEEFFTNLKTIYESIQNTYKRETDSLKKFYNVVYNTQDFSKFYTVQQGTPEFTFTNVTLMIPIKREKEFAEQMANPSVRYLAEQMANPSVRYLKLQNIFDILELSDIIPLIAFNDNPRTTPKIKVYNHLIEHVSENTIRSWIFNEKKKLQQVSYKKIRGLMIKYHIPNLNTLESSINNYITLLLDEMGSITVKITLDEDNTRSLNDIIDIIHFTAPISTPTIAWQQFKDILNRTHYKRVDNNDGIKLSQPLNYNDLRVVVVEGADRLPTPDKRSNKPGVIWLDGERIEYFAKTGNDLRQLRRGTLGTGVKDTYPTNTPVYGGGIDKNIPYRDETIVWSPVDAVTEGQTDFTLDFTPNSVNEFEVFAAGTRLNKAAIVKFNPAIAIDSPEGDVNTPAEFTVSGNVLTLTNPMSANQKLVVIRKIGKLWTTPGTPLKDAQNDIGSFLRGAQSELPE